MTAANESKWLSYTQVACRLSMTYSSTFKQMWREMEIASESEKGFPIGPDRQTALKRINGAWRLNSDDYPDLERYVNARCPIKDESWLDKTEIRHTVPGDCETLAVKLWDKIVAISLNAQSVSVLGKPLVIERRRNEAGQTEVCLSRNSEPLFLKAVSHSRQKVAEREAMMAMRDYEYESAPRM